MMSESSSSGPVVNYSSSADACSAPFLQGMLLFAVCRAVLFAEQTVHKFDHRLSRLS